MRARLFIFFMLIFNLGGLWAQQVGHHSQFPLRCNECHYCNKPTYNEPCLKICPNFIRKGITIHHSVDEAPVLFVMDTLANRYAPVVFNHRLHARMAEMMGGCSSCHHHNPPGKILACIACHQPNKKSHDITRPSLEGAYHQLCISCHRKWDTTWQTKSDCYSCHPKISEDISKNRQKLIELARKKHPKPATPKVFVLKSDYEEAPLVTFYHDQHIFTFGLNCVSCHKNNACSNCHTLSKNRTEVTLSHENCMPCHEKALDENCNLCHGKAKKASFTHAKTGWPLKSFHKSLQCQACHKNQTEYTALNPNCSSCHNTNKWQPGTFNHGVTGLILDENHRENDCESCHIERRFDKPPQCSECHDDKAFPKDKPGKIIGKR